MPTEGFHGVVAYCSREEFCVDGYVKKRPNRLTYQVRTEAKANIRYPDTFEGFLDFMRNFLVHLDQSCYTDEDNEQFNKALSRTQAKANIRYPDTFEGFLDFMRNFLVHLDQSCYTDEDNEQFNKALSRLFLTKKKTKVSWSCGKVGSGGLL
ncbi:hypothetical protein CCACVL1_18610 [Corchorus capsularis]|uniref:Uncharacterized protein n=1 Tax=Corchorus capsularis TaxID=210143 RepID=A0A1R3HKI2_COCAP|nr:hypothetical protein CCACVL1_18610 [Corchorus capsularis]